MKRTGKSLSETWLFITAELFLYKQKSVFEKSMQWDPMWGILSFQLFSKCKIFVPALHYHSKILKQCKVPYFLKNNFNERQRPD